MPHATNHLARDIASLKGVGEKTAQALKKSGINSVFDALLRVPKSVVEEVECPGFAHMEAGRTYVAPGRVIGVKITGLGTKKRLEAVVEDDSGRMTVVFFGPAVNYVQNTLKAHSELIFTGEVKNFLGRPQMVHPKIAVPKDDALDAKAQANYSQIAGINSASFKKIVAHSLKLLSEEQHQDHLSETILKDYQLDPLLPALEAIHQPGDKNYWDEKAHNPSFKRLAFEEILSFFLHLYQERSPGNTALARSFSATSVGQLSEHFIPFPLTGAQQRVTREIISDLKGPYAMSRLIQGDVGSGKTAVSALAARHAMENRTQVAVMAPTEILAEQLFQVYQKLFASLPHKIALLTASTKTKDRRLLLEALQRHEIDCVIGTHALLSDDVRFHSLGLVIIDEQHRFGVNQRGALVERFHKEQGYFPHLMVMSATPIPRSLALTMYGDLDISVIDERPPGRTPVLTKILSGDPIKSLLKLCERLIASQQKSFIVFPLVEESEHLDLENATKAASLLKEQFGQDSVGLLHGKMKADEKQKIMADFRDNRFRFLVSTTVVEVGVDIPDASCIAIIHPERFGLAQLHQLRGRVGRSDIKSFCFLLTTIQNKFSSAFQRLNAMCDTDDGFKLAQVDLKIRGPGELLGTRQSGVPNFLVFNHTEFASLVEPAKQLAKTLAQQKPSLPTLHLFTYQSPHFS